jgi:hypothetical protein
MLRGHLRSEGTIVTRILTFTFVLLLVLAAGCASPAASEVESQPPATEEATPEPEPTDEPSEEPGEPSAQAGAGDLAALLPEEVGGLTIEYTSASGDDVFSSEGAAPPAADAFLEELGADPADISSAFGFAFDATSGEGISIVAFRVEGADEGALRDAFVTAMESEGTLAGEETTVGGKSVLFMGDAEATNGYLYVHDDVAYLVSGEPAELAEEALAALP